MIDIQQKDGIFQINQINETSLHFLSENYQAAQPFPHIVIDNFLPEDFLEKVLQHFPERNAASVSHKSKTQFLKRGYRPQDLLNSPIIHYLSVLNTVPLLRFLETLTGIERLIPDPYFMGGGLHETDTGGHLDIHVDFSWHSKLRLARRLNMIIFLNKDWKKEYGGNLELWDTEMKAKVISVSPIYNRCVVFSTTHNSYHGQPEPVTCPPEMSRRSIALYYYTSVEKQDDLTTATIWKSKIENKSYTKRIFNKFNSIVRKK